MANPNIVNVSNIFGNVSTLVVSTTATAIVSNPASSGVVYKINSLTAANINTSSSAAFTAELHNNGTTVSIIRGVIVPATSSVTVVGKDNGFYLTENSSIILTAGANSFIHAVCSYEQIS